MRQIILLRKTNPCTAIIFLLVLCLPVYKVLAETVTDNSVFAKVNQQVISAAQYFDEFNKGVRETFYHGKVSEKELADFRSKVTTNLINHVLLMQEAKRLGIKPDPKAVEKQIGVETQKYQKQKNWQNSKQAIIDSIKQKIEVDNIIEQLKQRTQTIARPSVKDVKRYYSENQDKFTAPKKWNVSIILIKVPPSSPNSDWMEASELADDLVKKLKAGENFEELARIHSGDDSAADGGNMGYIHTGMLSKPAQKVLNTLHVGQVSDPVMLLQGVAIFRLNAVQDEVLNKFDDVKKRAEELLVRDLKEQAWKKLEITLRHQASIQINKSVVDSASARPKPQL